MLVGDGGGGVYEVVVMWWMWCDGDARQAGDGSFREPLDC